MEWKNLDIDAKKTVDEYCKEKFKISDLNYTNFILWSKTEDIKYLEKDEVLYIKGEYEKEEYFFPPMVKDIEKDIDKLKMAFKGLIENKKKIVFIPEEYVEKLPEIEFIENRDSFDYIYLSEDLAFLKGRRYAKKKNKVSQFIRYNYTYEKIDAKNIEEVKEFQKLWYEINQGHKNHIIDSENIGIDILIKNYEKLNLIGALLKVEGKVVAYTIGERLSKDMAVVHIEKGLIDYRGSYQAINYFFVQNELKEYKYVNREDDFGDEGLREAKLSYLPVFMLKKYRLN